MELTLVVLAAGIGSRYGGVKQLEPVGPGGETLLDYGIYDAVRAGFSRVVLVTRRDLEDLLREHIDSVFGNSIEVAYAFQELDDLPPGFTVPAERRKPWGTGHAVQASRHQVRGPFVAMNADDFYGATAFTVLSNHLHSTSGLEFAAAGYRLTDTLSPHGGVSRAVCELDADGYLRRVTEVKQISEAEAGGIAGVTVQGERIALTGDETVSMNIWAAAPIVFSLLSGGFARFLEENASDADAEFFLSESVNDLIAMGAVRVRVLPTPGPWLGVTYKEDRPYVVEKLRGLIDAGFYPENLSALN
jgi:hypothetical protein